MFKSQSYTGVLEEKSTHDIKHIAYNTLVRPTLEYYSMMWAPHTHSNIVRLEQNKH